MERVDAGARSFQLVGAGAQLTNLDGGGAGTVLRTHGGNVDLSDLTVSGGTAPMGAGFHVEGGGRLSLTHVVVTGMESTDTNAQGIGVWAEDTQVYLSDVVLTGITHAPSVGEASLDGGAVYVSGGGLTLTDVWLEGLSAAYSVPRGELVELTGLAISADDADVDLFDVEILDASLAMEGEGTLAGSVMGGLLSLRGSELYAERLPTEGTSITVSDGSIDLIGGLVSLYQTPATLEGYSSVGDVVDAGTSSYSRITGGLLFAQESDWLGEAVWISDGSWSAEGTIRGGLVETIRGDGELTHAVIAANSVGSRQLTNGFGGLMMCYEGGLTAAHASVVSNACEGAIYGCVVGMGAQCTGVEIHSTDISDNTTWGGWGSVLATDEDAPSSVSWSNLHGNSVPLLQVFYGDEPELVDNLSEDSGYVDTRSATAACWDLSLDPASRLVDKGDPDCFQDDGTRCDIGAMGGSTLDFPEP